MTMVMDPPRIMAPPDDDDEQHCRVCGCTDDFACDPPCWWVEDDLCSACEEPADG